MSLLVFNDLLTKMFNKIPGDNKYLSGACPGIRKRGGPKSESLFFFFFFLLFNFSWGGGPAQKIAEKMIFSTKKVAKYR